MIEKQPEELRDIIKPVHLGVACKFCKRPLDIVVDEYYTKDLGDPHKILPMAACNNCADFRVARRHVVDALWQIAGLDAQHLLDGFEEQEKARKAVEALLNSYLKAFAKYQGRQAPQLDLMMVDVVMQNPRGFQNVLGRIPALFTTELLEPTLF